MEFKKGAGTSGIEGQFYETKLLALILFRLQYDDRISDFYLATNMDEMGSLDDICLVIEIIGQERPVALFIQLKHKERDEAYLTLDNKSKSKYLDSFLKITKIISGKDCDKLFCTNVAETDCIFILYTNGEFRYTNTATPFTSSYSTILHELIGTSDTVGYQMRNFGSDFGENVLMLLAQHFVKFLSEEGKSSMNIMNDEYIQQYHVILKQRVVDVSDIEIDQLKPDSKWRTITFKRDFFITNDTHIALFRDYVFQEILRKLRNNKNNIKAAQKPADNSPPEQSIDQLISSFLTDPTADTLSPLIGTHITCNEDGKLKFLIKRTADDINQLRKIEISRKIVEEATRAANKTAEKYLQTLKPQKTPTSFGNVDLAIRDSKLNNLVTAIISLCQRYEEDDSYKIVTIDENTDEKLLNGGFTSAVGNILIYDEVTNMFKFANDSMSLPKIAKDLLKRLTTTIGLENDITNLRFHINKKKFPKLQFDCVDTAKEFLDRFVIYAKQSNQSKVEDILIKKIQERLSADRQNSLNSHSVFLHYHEEILKWWMTPKTGLTRSLSKASNLYERAINNMKAEPQISDLDTAFYMNNLRYFEHTFSNLAIDEMKLPKVLSQMFVVTDTVALSTVKAIQYLKHRYSIDKYAVLDLECIYNLSTANFCTLEVEIRKTERLVIFVWQNNESNSDSDIRLRELAQAIKEKQLIVITNREFREKVKKYFGCANDVFKCEIESLTTLESQKLLINNKKVIFQDQEVNLSLILDKKTVEFVRGCLLDKVIRNETVYIGAKLTNERYEEIKELYVDRKLRLSDKSDDDAYTHTSLVNTFYDIVDDVVLVTADPGIGKSTLLTHLSVKTKEHHMNLWIVRVNFLDYSSQFRQWQDDDIIIDDLESLKLLCQVILKDRNVSFDIEIRNGAVRLIHCEGNELCNFELNMFLHFYNEGRLVFIFDGFDEICPHYKSKVVDFLSVTKNQLRKSKMWVTSRPYSDILPDLRSVLGRVFIIDRLDFTEQQSYLNTFWNKKLKIAALNNQQLKNVRTFVYSKLWPISKSCYWIKVICHSFYDHVRPILDRAYTVIQPKLKMNEGVSNEGIESLSGIPLILYFVADYFIILSNIDGNRNKVVKLDLHSLYSMFVTNKIEKILFQEKNNMDLSNTFTRSIYEKELADCINVHKKLAAYDLLCHLLNLLNFEEFKHMEPLNANEVYLLLNKIKTGTEKSGLISYVTDDNVPVFIHRSFTEYFAAEYVCDILKSNKFNLHQKTLWFNAVEQYNQAVFGWVEIRKAIDEKLGHILDEIEARKIKKFDLIFTLKGWPPSTMSYGQSIRVLSSSVEDYENDCFDELLKRCGTPHNSDETVTEDYYYKKAYVYLISNMKPHLKQHFLEVPT